MIKVYYRGSCNSSKRAMKWFQEYNIPYQPIPISQLPRKELVRLLPLTDKGVNSLIKKSSKTAGRTQTKAAQLMDMKLNEGISFLNVNSELLQTPLIIDRSKFLVGFNKEEIRQFIPRERRYKSFVS